MQHSFILPIPTWIHFNIFIWRINYCITLASFVSPQDFQGIYSWKNHIQHSLVDILENRRLCTTYNAFSIGQRCRRMFSIFSRGMQFVANKNHQIGSLVFHNLYPFLPILGKTFPWTLLVVFLWPFTIMIAFLSLLIDLAKWLSSSLALSQLLQVP